MKGRLKYIIILIVIVLVGIYWDTVRYAHTEDRAPKSEMIVATYDVDKITVDDEAEVLIIIQSNGEDINPTGMLFAYTRERNADGEMTDWKEVKIGDEIKIGVPVLTAQRGVGKTKDGDRKTPKGMYTLSTPFGINEAEEGFPGNYVQLTGSMYWDGDKDSPTFNSLVDSDVNTEFRKEASVHLIDRVPEYKYCLVIGYNQRGDIQAGKSVFLCCFDRDRLNTDGDVSTDEDTMKTILRIYKEGKTRILIDEKYNLSNYY